MFVYPRNYHTVPARHLGTLLIGRQRDKEVPLPSGPWDHEPDVFLFPVDKDAYGLVLRVSGLGHLCGYLGVPTEIAHDLDMNQIECHGGLTGGNDQYLSGEYQFFGFDCAHWQDLSPFDVYFTVLHGTSIAADKEYRDVEFCVQEIRSMARQVRGQINHA